MKNTIMPLICLLFFTSLEAQNIEKTFRPEFYNTLNSILVFDNNKIVIGGKGRQDFDLSSKPFLIMVDTLGNIIWEHDFFEDFTTFSIPDAQIATIKDIYKKNDRLLIHLAVSCCCDVGLTSYIVELDEMGETINFKSIFKHNNLAEAPNQYITHDFYNVYWYDSTFQYLAGKSLFNVDNFLFELTDIVYTESHVLVSAINDASSCALMSLTLNDFDPDFTFIQSECEGYSNIQNMEVDLDGNIFIQNDNRLVHLDNNLNEINELIFHDSVQINDLQFSQSQLLVFIDSMGEMEIQIFDQSFNLLNTIEFENDLKLIPRYAQISSSGNKIYVVGEERSKHEANDLFGWIESDSRSSIFFRTYNLNGGNNFPSHDIGITQVSVDAPLTTYSPNCNFYELAECGQTIGIEYKDVRATIHNYGNTILNECTVNARLNQCGNCSYFCPRTFTFSQKYENLNLMPGDSVEVLFGDIAVDDQKIGPHELCLWTGNPNNIIDKNIENDAACFESNISVSVDEFEKEIPEIILYPNPSQIGIVDLKISSSKGEKTILIYDTLGKEVANYSMASGNDELTINTSTFNTGIYFVSIKFDTFSFAKKLVIN